MHITITRQQLSDADACKAGLEWFDSATVGGVIAGEWNRETQLAAICLGAGPWWGWAVDAGILPAWSMADVDLRRANLSRANLSGADLRWADLRGADLLGASRFSSDHTIPGWTVQDGQMVRA